MPAPPTSVAVIGAGIVGVAIAGELARRGARVTVIDARGAGRGATQASAGMLAPFTEARPGSVLSDLCAEGLAVFDEAVARVRRDSGGDFEYARTGTVEVALDVAAAAHLRQTADDLRARGIEAICCDAADTAAREPALTRAALASLLIPTHGFVAVTDFVAALAAAARAYGAHFVSGAAVERVQPVSPARATSSAAFTGSPPRGAVPADHVVLAAGCWSGRIAIDGDPPLPMRAVRGQLLELRPRDPGVTRILWGPRCYLVPWANGALLVGATVEEGVDFDERLTVEGLRQLAEAAAELVPALADATFVQARVGLRPAAADDVPIIGASTDVPGLVYATGHFRNGVLLSPLTAAIVADLVLEGRRHPALAALSASRFQHVSRGVKTTPDVVFRAGS
jgi:glycine oxidase